MGRRSGFLTVAGLFGATLLAAPSAYGQEDGVRRSDPIVPDAWIYDEAVYTSPRDLCPCVGPTRGSIVIAGGGELPDEIYKTFVRLAGGRSHAHIVVIPTAADDAMPDPAEIAALVAAGAASVEILHTRDRTVADSEQFVEPLRRATGVWFSGGRQYRLIDAYRRTRVQRELHGVLGRGGVVGGTSAGASTLASYLVRGTPDGTLRVTEPGFDVGLGLLRGVAVDQHLLARGREQELQRIVELYPQLLGIGLDEGTALVIKGDFARVEGASRVAIYDRGGWSSPVAFRFLSAGDSYDLGQWRSIRAVSALETPGS
jgi:cyanophycinase